MGKKTPQNRETGYTASDFAACRNMTGLFRKMCVLFLCACIMTALCACGGSSAGGTEAGSGNTGNSNDSSGSAQDAGTIIIGSKDFTENEIVAEIYALALEDAGFTVERRMNIASSVIHTSLVNKEVEL